jgi:hypothetical protein
MPRCGRPANSRKSVCAGDFSYFSYCFFASEAGTVWSSLRPTISSGARSSFLKCTSLGACRWKLANPAS